MSVCCERMAPSAVLSVRWNRHKAFIVGEEWDFWDEPQRSRHSPLYSRNTRRAHSGAATAPVVCPEPAALPGREGRSASAAITASLPAAIFVPPRRGPRAPSCARGWPRHRPATAAGPAGSRDSRARPGHQGRWRGGLRADFAAGRRFLQAGTVCVSGSGPGRMERARVWSVGTRRAGS